MTNNSTYRLRTKARWWQRVNAYMVTKHYAQLPLRLSRSVHKLLETRLRSPDQTNLHVYKLRAEQGQRIWKKKQSPLFFSIISYPTENLQIFK